MTLKSRESSFHVLTDTRDSTCYNRGAKTPTQSVQLSKYFRLSSSDQLVSLGLSPDGEDQHSGDSMKKENWHFSGSKEGLLIWRLDGTTRKFA